MHTDRQTDRQTLSDENIIPSIHFVHLTKIISFLHHLRSFGTYTLT